MARSGVTEQEVHDAADALLATGDRPTIERVRAKLGTGSPNTLIRHLDTWWASLGRRLSVQAAKLAIPDAPAEVTAAANAMWTAAVAQAQASVASERAQGQAAIETERATLVAIERDMSARVEQAESALAEAHATRRLTEAHLHDLQRSLAQHERQHLNDTEQLRILALRIDELEQERSELQGRLQAQTAAATQERESAAAHIQTVEDRAHAEVDRARQETKLARVRQETAEKEARKAAAASKQRGVELLQALAAAEQSAMQHGVRARALEEQLVRLDGLGDALRAAQEAVRAGLERETGLRDALIKHQQARPRRRTAATGKKPHSQG